MSELADKERRAIKILRMYRGDGPIATPIAIGAAVWLYINDNEKKR